jgi:predicted nucleic acid-binding protein
MKSLVIDGSTTLAFFLKDEHRTLAVKALKAMESGTPTYVPAHWWLETANGLIMAERRKRASQADITDALGLVQALPVITDDQTAQRCGGDTFGLARQYALTIYDAAYLELAMRRRSILATSDQALARAAATAGVTVLS